jgi:hypothetical protein
MQTQDSEEDTSEICLPPSASDLLESMRAMGYSFEAAVADIVDNSLSASASNIAIRFPSSGEPYVAILDDGTGMSSEALTAAMRHGSQNPTLQRKDEDLGRFGLGMKTASLSQCRRMTVVSLKESLLSGRCWDLDHVALRQNWMLLRLKSEEIANLPQVEQLRAQGHGTLVLWQNFDRLVAGEVSIQQALGKRMDELRDHLALVFHRFLSPQPGQVAVTIAINNLPVKALDPFLTKNKATQPLPAQHFKLEGEIVPVQAYILPHISRLTPEELDLAGGDDGLRKNQGFYIYRNRRLICWGSWFRLVRQEELSKLARVQVDLSNRLDHLWKLDIKKSATTPPEVLREGLKQIIGRITDGSRNVFIFRGKKASDKRVVHAWDRTIVRDGVIYRVNRDHPLIFGLRDRGSEETAELVEQILSLLERSLPLDAIYLDKASHIEPPTEGRDSQLCYLEGLASQIVSMLGAGSSAASQFIENMATVEPFNKFPTLAAQLAQRLSSEQ